MLSLDRSGCTLASHNLIKKTMFRFLIFLYQEKENRSASPEKQVDKEREGEAEGTQFSTLYKTLKQPNKIGKTMSDNLSVPLAFIGE